MPTSSIQNNEDVIKDYISFLELQGFRSQTIESKIWNVKVFAKRMNFCDLRVVARKDIESYISSLKKSKKKESSQRLNQLHLKSFYEWLSPGNDLFKNVKLRTLKKDTSKKEYINSDDVIKLLSVCTNEALKLEFQFKNLSLFSLAMDVPIFSDCDAI
jgi:site-specific recombinase XerD